MSNIQGPQPNAEIIEKVIMQGDLAKLSPEQRLNYYTSVCQSLGLNPLTKPFDYIQLNGKLTLYAKKDATDQLRRSHKISIVIAQRDHSGDICIVTARATLPDGRCDEATGVVSIGGLKGDSLANALMKAETKAKRRVTLSICGLGFLDETEIETIPSARHVYSDVNKIEKPVYKVDNHVYNPDHKTQTVKDLVHTPLPPQPKQDQDGEYVVTFGKYKGETISSINPVELANYVSFLTRKAEEEKKPLRGQVLDFINAADETLSSSEQEDMDELDIALSRAVEKDEPYDPGVPFEALPAMDWKSEVKKTLKDL